MKHWTQALTKPYTLLALMAIVTVVVITTMNSRAGEGDTLIYKPNPQRTVSFESGSVEIPTLTALDEMFAKISEYTLEAVVHISVTKEPRGQFGSESSGDGSGFIYTQDGWIVTNDHVIEGATEVKVVLADGRELVGVVHRVNDISLDIALVKVNAENLKTLKFADSNQVVPGRFAIAVGSPFGLENSVTIGHVSAIGRPGQASDGRQAPRLYAGMIQTDASINPGNSGGPLVNIHGDVIGVNTSIYSLSGSSSGIGFAIPSNVVSAVVNEMIEEGSFDRGLMGLVPRDLKPFEQKDLGTKGAFITLVEPGNPASDAGIQTGDIITRINDTVVDSEIDLRVALYQLSPSDKIKVNYFRDGKTKETELTLKDPPTRTAPVQQQRPTPQREFGTPSPDQFREYVPQRRPTLGVSLKDVDSTERKTYSLPRSLEGAVIYLVRKDTVAERAGLIEGDVITEVAGTTIKSADDVVKALRNQRMGERITIKYARMNDGLVVMSEVTVRLE